MDMGPYFEALRETALKAFKRFNQTGEVESQRVDFPAGSIDISVVRGRLLEKAATARIRLRTAHPETGEETRFDVFQIKTYPLNPRHPILLVNIENRLAADDRFGGFLDLAPVAMNAGDLAPLETGMKTLAGRYGEDYGLLRGKLAALYKRDHWEKALNAGIGIRLDLPAEQCDLVKEAGITWLAWYCALLDKRPPDHSSSDEEALMYRVRSRILEFYLLKDRSFQIIQKLGVPLETMALVHFAPTIRY